MKLSNCIIIKFYWKKYLHEYFRKKKKYYANIGDFFTWVWYSKTRWFKYYPLSFLWVCLYNLDHPERLQWSETHFIV